MNGEFSGQIRQSRRNLRLEPEFSTLPLSPRRVARGNEGGDFNNNVNNSDADETFSVVTRLSEKSMESKLSGVSSHRSLMLRKKMKAEIESLEKINAMEAELDAQKIAMEEKRLERAKALEKRRVDLMAIILEEDDGKEFHMAEFRTPEAAPRDKNVKIEAWIEKTRTEQPETLKEDLSIVRHLAANNSRMERMMARQTVSKELPIFDGKSEEWPMFLRHFQRTSETCGLTDDENMIRLQKCLKGRARDAVLPVLGMPENVATVMNTLEMMFGRPNQVIETMVQKVRVTQAPKEGKPDTLIAFSNQVANLVANMKLMKKTGHMNNPTLMNELVIKLPYQLQFLWGQEMLNMSSDPSLENLASWMQKMALTVSLLPNSSGSHNVIVENEHKKQNKKTVLTAVEKTDKSTCSRCKAASHAMKDCKKFQDDKVSIRWRIVKTGSLCFCCLEAGHRTLECPVKKPCEVSGCEKFHHKLLHKDVEIEKQTEKDAEKTSQHCGHSFLKNAIKEVLLRILPVKLSSSVGEVSIYALLDEGAEVTMVDESVIQQLQITGQNKPLCMQWTNDMSREENTSMSVTVDITGVAEGAKRFTLYDVRTVRNLSLKTQTIDMDIIREKWPYLQDIPFASIRNAQPLILIGSDNITLSLSRQHRQGRWNDPVATKTWLGWVVHGNLVKSNRVDHVSVHTCEPSRESELNQMIYDSFSTESFGVKLVEQKLRSKEDEQAWDIMKSTTRRRQDRFETGLLWRQPDIRMPESKTKAMRRLTCMERKMDKDVKFAEAYCKTMEDFIQKKYCRKLSVEEATKQSQRTWYIPHFAVVNVNKPGKLRLVFDAAAKSHGLSLNDCLLKGPDLLNPLPAVLLRFRKHKVSIMGDIKEMFPQVKIIAKDVDSQRFLWRGKERNREPDTYVMDSMIFGASCSPASANFIKNLNAEEFKEEFPEETKAVLRDSYVDDLLYGAEDEDLALKHVYSFIELFKRGGFRICNWTSSSERVMAEIPEEYRTKGAVNFQMHTEFTERVLGLSWSPEQDVFMFQMKFPKVSGDVVEGSRIPTKREVLKLVMSVFDPLGFIAHFVVQAKILFQQIWLSKLDWDDQLNSQQNSIWQAWLKQLKGITTARIPRCYSFYLKDADKVVCHTFVDASTQAMAAVSFQVITTGDIIESAFIIAKTRVAPTKPLSVPRLELQAALMGTRLTKTILAEIDIPIIETHFWSDSRTVLCWIRSENRNFKQFVGHRIGEILESTEVKDWHWVPTSENVADDGTRMTKEFDFASTSRWYHGPSFIKQDQANWPAEPEVIGVELPDEEVKKVFVSSQRTKFSFPKSTRFSSWLKTVRTTAWICRFITNFLLKCGKKTLVKGELSLDELARAERLWCKAVQRECFPVDIKCLESGEPLESNSRLLKLTPYMDLDGIIRVKGRTELSTRLNNDTKFPIILDPKHNYTRLLLKNYHEQGAHIGIETVLNNLRQKYWVIQMRAAVKTAFYNCQLCKIRKVKPLVPMMSMLPLERVEVQEHPFACSGVDYFGPIMVTVGRHQEKRYGVLFTCLSVRAVHLELAKDLSSDATINAIRRFLARRGPIRKLFSDNGTNFHGADNELRKSIQALDCPMIRDNLARKGIEWRFIPPGSPHMGGYWERLVKSVKVALGATVKQIAPYEDVLHTLLLEAEYLINSRPLTHVSVDPDDPESLTPNHFLLKKNQVELPLGRFDEKDLLLRRQWRKVQRLSDIFWNRWVKEYLPTLTRRTKWYKDSQQIKMDDIVVIADKDGPRNSWPLGQIVNVYPGKDGRTRVADVKTKDGVYRRPVHKICVLDVRRDDEEKQIDMA